MHRVLGPIMTGNDKYSGLVPQHDHWGGGNSEVTPRGGLRRPPTLFSVGQSGCTVLVEWRIKTGNEEGSQGRGAKKKNRP